ncbi:unnamed protein product [Alopecurus aequalis]
MAFPPKQLAPCLCTILILLSITSFSHVKAQPCKCSDSDQDRRSNRTIDDVNDPHFYLIDKESKDTRRVVLSFLRNLSGTEQKNFQVFSTIAEWIPLWQERPSGLGVDVASFSVSIVYQPLPNQRPSSLSFLILPGGSIDSLTYALARQADRSLNLQAGTSRNAAVSRSSVSVTITQAIHNHNVWMPYCDVLMVIDINIDAAAALTYAVWIIYDRDGRRLSVYVDLEGNPMPENTIVDVNLDMSDIASNYTYSQYCAFGLLTTVAQQLSVGRWNATVEDLPSYPDKGSLLSEKVTILCSVLGSVAVTAMMATALACYFNSRYRRWHKDLDQLARSMERLPGVPTKVEFADINKATGNFHETMKLGGGGFGTVYRCTLPATAVKRELPMDVAVKRFTRDVQNHRYDDFLAEVSIINRLRHKNIVPLVGWSYVQQRRASPCVRVHDQRQFGPTSLPKSQQWHRELWGATHWCSHPAMDHPLWDREGHSHRPALRPP